MKLWKRGSWIKAATREPMLLLYASTVVWAIFSFVSATKDEPYAVSLVVTAVIVSVCVVLFAQTLSLQAFSVSGPNWRMRRLASMLNLCLGTAIFVLIFAQFYWATAQRQPEAFTGGHMTKLDALYFTVGTLTTAGTGEISPHATTARVAVTIQELVGFFLVAVVLSVALSRIF